MMTKIPTREPKFRKWLPFALAMGIGAVGLAIIMFNVRIFEGERLNAMAISVVALITAVMGALVIPQQYSLVVRHRDFGPYRAVFPRED